MAITIMDFSLVVAFKERSGIQKFPSYGSNSNLITINQSDVIRFNKVLNLNRFVAEPGGRQIHHKRERRHKKENKQAVVDQLTEESLPISVEINS
ncbi:CLUMA_CG018564, isoform A [Clunio marinus]|uniref:CLUMA_CG018564, isoform A n=1 Tax=Clunio marinus TaxID=568069 RepID=A0A1J1IYS1_9DIPT|nr:CLUMA_CG018564, isoform A [Clunio marinus]